MRVITQNGVEMDFSTFGVVSRGTKVCVTGTIESPQSGSRSVYDKGTYIIGEYKDIIVATRVTGELTWYEGKEPYKMPPEDYDRGL